MGDALEDGPSGLDAAAAEEGRGRGLRARRVPHRGLRRHVEGPDRGRALRPGHHGHDAPRELVHGQERRRDAHRSAHPAGRLRRSSRRRPSRSGRPRATRGAPSASPTSCTCRAACGSAHRYDPDFDPQGPYPDHLYLYTGGVDSYHYAATRPQQWPPNTVGRYRNTDPVLASYLVRLAVTKRGEDYLSFPQRALFDKLGIRTMVLETDPYGNFLTQGYELASARDWARLGNLYLQDGVWNGERLLPEGYVKFVSTVAPAWQADHRPIYGGFFWINGDRRAPRPPRGLLHVRRRRPDDADHPVPRPRGGPPRPLQGQRPGPASLQPRAGAAHGRGAEAALGLPQRDLREGSVVGLGSPCQVDQLSNAIEPWRAPSSATDLRQPCRFVELLPGHPNVRRREHPPLPLVPGVDRPNGIVGRAHLGSVLRDPVHARQQFHAVGRLEALDQLGHSTQARSRILVRDEKASASCVAPLSKPISTSGFWLSP